MTINADGGEEDIFVLVKVMMVRWNLINILTDSNEGVLCRPSGC